jgi:putative methylase
VQKRLVRKINLARLLSQVEPHPTPKPSLEQYTIPVELAATILHLAAYTYGDIIGKTILDLGCGTGRLALGAAFLGAKQVTGVDVDKTALKVASKNSERTCLKEKVQWIATDISSICGNFDTVVQNPPYGVQKQGADTKFLEKALEIGKTVYSLHKSSKKEGNLPRGLQPDTNRVVPVDPSPFLEGFVEDHGGRIKAVYAMIMVIPHMFSYHVKRKHEFPVDLYILERR